MHIVPLLHDELLDGYRGRLAVVNNARSKAGIHKLINAAYPVVEVIYGQSAFVPSLAKALELPLEVLLNRHTMWPLLAAFPDVPSALGEARTRYSAANSSAWLKTLRKSLWMCPHCIQEDLKRHYFSYWRKSHQLPGRYFCSEHGQSLRFCSIPKFLTSHPDALLDRSEAVDPNLLEETSNNKWVQATVQILAGISAAERTMGREEVTPIFRSLSGLDNEELTITEAVKTLSNLIVERLPQAWLKDLMPNAKLSDSDRLQFLLAVLTTAKTISLSAAAAAIVAAHFMDAKEAIRLLTLAD
jgi:hypothetical protein